MSLDEFIINALKEDVGDGDHTSIACINPKAKGKSKLIIKEKGVLAGVELAEKIFHHVDDNSIFHNHIKDGSLVKNGDIAFIIEGKSIALLAAERLVLNCMQRMSGIATETDRTLRSLNGLKTKLIDTRKTTPGFRMIEKWAVRIGGGGNHRFGLYDMIMIKDNHIDFSGGIRQAIEKVRMYLDFNKKDLKIAIEARNFQEIREIISTGGVHRIMLDNFTPENLKEAVKLIDGRFETEATGRITYKNIRSYAESEVDYISSGALTHTVKILDMSMKAVI